MQCKMNLIGEKNEKIKSNNNNNKLDTKFVRWQIVNEGPRRNWGGNEYDQIALCKIFKELKKKEERNYNKMKYVFEMVFETS